MKSLKQECLQAAEQGVVVFDSERPCRRCGECRRYTKSGQCVSCAINRHVNRRAMAVMAGKIKPRGSLSALAKAVEGYLEGQGLVAAAKAQGVSVARLRRALNKAGHLRSQEEIKLEQALAKVRAGMGVREAATECFVPIVAIERVLVAAGEIGRLSEVTDPELIEMARGKRALGLFPAPQRRAA